MTVGLPGSGIGGVFYLLSALAMPFVALWRVARRQPVSWSAVIRQTSLAVGIVAGLWITGWWLAVGLAHTPLGSLAARAASDASQVPNLLRAGAVAVALGTLGLIMGVVWIAALAVHGPAAFRSARRVTHPPPDTVPPPIARAASDR